MTNTRIAAAIAILLALSPSACRQSEGDQAKTHEPGSSQTPTAWAQALYERRDYAAALAAFERIAQQRAGTDDGANAVMMIGLCHGALGDSAKAEKALREYVKKQPTAAGYYYLAEALDRAGKSKEAEATLEQALAAKPVPRWVEDAARESLSELKTGSRALTASGQAKFAAKNFKAALSDFQKIVARSPKSKAAENARMMTALCYQKLGNLEKAEQAFREYLRDYAGDAAAFYYYGEVLIQRGKEAEARALMEKALAAPDQPAWLQQAAQEKLRQLKDDSGSKG